MFYLGKRKNLPQRGQLKHVLPRKAEKPTSKRVIEACFTPESGKTYLKEGN
jgi:hypothetical protein